MTKLIAICVLSILTYSVASFGQASTADETSAGAPPEKSAEPSIEQTDVWSDQIAPLSFNIGYGLRTDRNHVAQSGTMLGLEYRLLRGLSLQLQGIFGFRARDNFNSGDGWHSKDDLWGIYDLGAKWSPLLFTLIRHPTDLFLTGGLVTATSTGGAMKVGTNYFIGGGATYYFEPTVKGVLDLRVTPGHRGFNQLSAGINFQFP